MPQWVENWGKTSLISIDDKNNDGLVQYRKDPAVNEVTIDKDIMVLANPEIANLPNWVIALVAAGGLGRSVEHSCGSAAGHQHRHQPRPAEERRDAEDHREEGTDGARIAAAVAVVIAGYFGINPPGFVAQVVAFAFGLAAASFFPIIIMGIFSKRMNKEGAMSGMIVGLLFTLAYIIYFKFVNPTATADDWWFGISPEGIGTLGMLLNFAVSFAVSQFTPPPPQDVQDLVEDIRIPRGAGEATHH
jgi:cation/acetate symporter